MMCYEFLRPDVVLPSFNSEKPTHISRIVYQLFTILRFEGKRNSEFVLIEAERIVFCCFHFLLVYGYLLAAYAM